MFSLEPHLPIAFFYFFPSVKSDGKRNNESQKKDKTGIEKVHVRKVDTCSILRYYVIVKPMGNEVVRDKGPCVVQLPAEREGESAIYRHASIGDKPLLARFDDKIQTLYDAFA